MSHLLRFTEKHIYDSTAEGVAVNVYLSAGREKPIQILSRVDTGASHCLFERQYADVLGFEVEAGESFRQRSDDFGHMGTRCPSECWMSNSL
jgi:hypothetical protein